VGEVAHFEKLRIFGAT